MTAILLALVIGGAFGFALDRVGATNPGYIIRMLNLSDLHLMKTILFAIGVASIAMFGGQMLGIVDVGHMSVKGAYLGVLFGGILLGAGFAVAGYCPGTGLTALATGRRDAIFFVLGGLAGAGAYMLAYEAVEATGLLAKMFGGKATLGVIGGTDYPAVTEFPGQIAGIVLGLVFMLIALILPSRLTGGRHQVSEA